MTSVFRIKKSLYFLFPPLFAILTSAFYYFIFAPEPGTENFTNLLLVFSAGLGWSSNIFLGERGMTGLNYFYSAISVLLPLILLEIFRIMPYNIYWHRVMILMIFAADLWLIVINRDKMEEGGKSLSGDQ